MFYYYNIYLSRNSNFVLYNKYNTKINFVFNIILWFKYIFICIKYKKIQNYMLFMYKYIYNQLYLKSNYNYIFLSSNKYNIKYINILFNNYKISFTKFNFIGNIINSYYYYLYLVLTIYNLYNKINLKFIILKSKIIYFIVITLLNKIKYYYIIYNYNFLLYKNNI